jgi:hypothetical protein
MSYNSGYRLTLKTVNPETRLAGFIKGTLVIPGVRLDDTLAQHMFNLNQYRAPESQINHLYNRLGEEIDPSLWKMRISDNLTLYVDRR